jgi:prepilin-type processing-associated H-X9-DG protein
MPNLGQPDPFATGYPLHPLLNPYKVAHIKRSSEITYIFDGTLEQLPSGAWRVAGFPLGQFICDGWIFYTGAYFGGLLDNYSHYGSVPGANPGTPVVMMYGANDIAEPPQYTAAQLAIINTDDPSPSNVQNGFNIRFRHMQNTMANALFIDGHVESFTYNAKTGVPSLLFKNIMVNQ